MFNEWEVIYKDEDGSIYVLGEFSGNMGLTVDQALKLCDIDMDKFAEEQGWDDWDWNCIDFRFKK